MARSQIDEAKKFQNKQTFYCTSFDNILTTKFRFYIPLITENETFNVIGWSTDFHGFL